MFDPHRTTYQSNIRGLITKKTRHLPEVLMPTGGAIWRCNSWRWMYPLLYTLPTVQPTQQLLINAWRWAPPWVPGLPGEGAGQGSGGGRGVRRVGGGAKGKGRGRGETREARRQGRSEGGHTALVVAPHSCLAIFPFLFPLLPPQPVDALAPLPPGVPASHNLSLHHHPHSVMNPRS